MRSRFRRPRVVTTVHMCVWGPGPHESFRYHDAVLTAADDDVEFDRNVLGSTPNDHQYGYCRRCYAPMRWNVSRQRWEDWDGV